MCFDDYFCVSCVLITGRGHDQRDRHATARGEHVVARQARFRRRFFPVGIGEAHWRQGTGPPVATRHTSATQCYDVASCGRCFFLVFGQWHLLIAVTVQRSQHFRRQQQWRWQQRPPAYQARPAQTRQTHLLFQVTIIIHTTLPHRIVLCSRTCSVHFFTIFSLAFLLLLLRLTSRALSFFLFLLSCLLPPPPPLFGASNFAID